MPGRRWMTPRARAYSWYGDPRDGYPAEPPFEGMVRSAARAVTGLIVGGSQVAANLIEDSSQAFFDGWWRPYYGRWERGYGRWERDVPPGRRDARPPEADAPDRSPESVDEEWAGPMTMCESFERAFRDGVRVLGQSAEQFADESAQWSASRRRWSRRQPPPDFSPEPVASERDVPGADEDHPS